MIAFVVALVVIFIGLCVVAWGMAIRNDNEDAGIAVGLGVLFAVIGGGVLFFDSYTVIPTRTVGVQVSFGRPIGTIQNGWHWVSPWSSVEKFDASVQTLNLTTAKDDSGDPVTVRLGNQTTAQVDVSVQWNIAPEGDVIDLYRRYKNFDNVEHNLVKRQLQHALNLAFATYDPLRAINGTADAPSQSIDDLASKAKGTLQAAVGTGIQIGTLTIPIVHYDPDTENRLKAYQQALADTRIAEQRRKTAEQTRAANDILAGSASTKDAGVQYQNCLNLIADLAAKGQLKDLPPTFTCGSPSATPVIVGGR